MTLYLFPGQGSDRRIFKLLTFDPKHQIRVVEYGEPPKGSTMESFAKEQSKEIDASEKFILIGMSLGGMLCVELAEILNPEKTIIISSAKNRLELPLLYRFHRVIPLYKLVPGFFLVWGAKILQPLVEPDRNSHKETFKKMLANKKGSYMKRTIDLVINWKRTSNSKLIYQVHGNRDRTIPIRNIKSPTYVVENGSHMMTLTRAQEIGRILKEIIGN
jgi:pimeloyl-ACP methyl ester carboxylesterase